MTDTEENKPTRIWTPAGFTGDSWQQIAAEDALPREGNIILPLAGFLSLGAEEREAVAERIGVLINPGDDLDSIGDHLSSIALVALSFPAFSDGRAYSKAALLKSRHGFSGILRAVGDVLIDQVELMIRVGFDELAISNPATLARLEEGRTGGIPFHYQPGLRDENKSNRYTWRRRAA